jgi:hypothetical protein
MNLDKVLSEAVGDIWNNAHYGATSEEPRKDFVGFSTRDGYNFPYQHNAPPVHPPSGPQPYQTADLPWPLQTVSDDIRDSFVYLVAAHNKMKTCVDQNPSISKNQKIQIEHLTQAYKIMMGLNEKFTSKFNLCNTCSILIVFWKKISQFLAKNFKN